MALRGIRVLELEGLAPVPFCGMVLRDFGATVTTIEKVPISSVGKVLQKGKNNIALNLKQPIGRDILRKLCSRSDVLIDPYRPGVMERMKLGPDILHTDNPRLIYARISGFGQTGPFKHKGGHDINYVAIAGVLSMLGMAKDKPTPPINLLADFAGGGLLCAFGILAALLERHNSGKGQIVDSSMVEGAAYIASWLFQSRSILPIWDNKRGQNILDGGAFFYDTYETKDGKYMSVGAIEDKFYANFVIGIGMPDMMQYGSNTENAELVRQRFKTKTQKEWTDIFENLDACVFPVLDWEIAHENEQNVARNVFVNINESNGQIIPQPAPKLSRTPAVSGISQKNHSIENEWDILNEIGFHEDDFRDLQQQNIMILPSRSKL